MNLKSITINNYRSINNLVFDICQLRDCSYTFGLIGENEAGKSSFLKAVAFKDIDNNISVNEKDKTKRDNLIETRFTYAINESTRKKIIEQLSLLQLEDRFDSAQFIDLVVDFAYNTGTSVIDTYINFFNKSGDEEFLQLDEGSEILEIVESYVHKTIFWSYEERFLLSKEIILANFFSDPLDVSVPLTNCLLLAGYKIEQFKDLYNSIMNYSTDREEIRDKLGQAVTKHIRKVWRNHDIIITFDLTPEKINFHIKDTKSKSKAKTADQRSDGFKHFVSFLLTVSAQHKNAQLTNTILLLDEPETHLHPKAQEFFLEELKEISKTKNNIVFFATHSNYFIDKFHLERNYKVFKLGDNTRLKKFEVGMSSYGSVNFEVFGITSIEYHNELYGDLMILTKTDDIPSFDRKLLEVCSKYSIKIPIKKDYLHTNGKSFDCCLPTFIRNQISHSENRKNENYKPAELEKCIIIMQELKDKIQADIKSENNVAV